MGSCGVLAPVESCKGKEPLLPPAAKGKLEMVWVSEALAWSLGNDQLWALLELERGK